MSINQHLEEMKDILNIIQAFLDEPSDGEKFPNLKLKFDEYQISNSKYKLILLFRLIVTFANYHKRSPFFFNKIEHIILIFQVEMKNYFSNREIFNIFKSNKRLLLFLIEKKMMNIDKFIFTEFTKIIINIFYQN